MTGITRKGTETVNVTPLYRYMASINWEYCVGLQLLPCKKNIIQVVKMYKRPSKMIEGLQLHSHKGNTLAFKVRGDPRAAHAIMQRSENVEKARIFSLSCRT